MHLACNHTGLYAAAADKLLFQILMAGVGLPTPQLLAIARPKRQAANVRCLETTHQVAAFLRELENYPLFAKRIGGQRSCWSKPAMVSRSSKAKSCRDEDDVWDFDAVFTVQTEGGDLIQVNGWCCATAVQS